MKRFNEWIQERHPKSFQEFNLAKGARNFASKVGRGINKTRVGMKRAGQLIDKTLGDDPYERQKANRKNHQDKEALLRDLEESADWRKQPLKFFVGLPDEVWSLVHEYEPGIKEKIKQTLAFMASGSIAQNPIAKNNLSYANIAIAQILLDLSHEYYERAERANKV